MIKRFVAICLAEELVLALLLLYSNALVSGKFGSYLTLPLMAVITAALAFTNVAVYLQNRGMPWQGLFVWERMLRVVAALVTGTTAFMVAFAFVGTGLGYALTWRHSLEFSFGYGCFAGVFALAMAAFSRAPYYGLRHMGDGQDDSDEADNQE